MTKHGGAAQGRAVSPSHGLLVKFTVLAIVEEREETKRIFPVELHVFYLIYLPVVVGKWTFLIKRQNFIQFPMPKVFPFLVVLNYDVLR